MLIKHLFFNQQGVHCQAYLTQIQKHKLVYSDKSFDPAVTDNVELQESIVLMDPNLLLAFKADC